MKSIIKIWDCVKICKAYDWYHENWSKEVEDRCRHAIPNGQDSNKMLKDNSYGKQMKEIQSRHEWCSWRRQKYIRGMKNIYVKRDAAQCGKLTRNTGCFYHIKTVD